MENGFNKPREESTAETNSWDSLANVPFNDGETEAKAPEKLSKKFEASIASIDMAIDAARNDMSHESLMTLARARGAMEEELKKALFNEAMATIPEENQDAFAAYSNEASSTFSIDTIVKGINMKADGKSMDEIKDYIVSRDWGVPDPELNAKRGEVVYKEFLGFITPKNAE